MNRNPVTPEGYEALVAALKREKEIVRPGIVRDIEEARAHGDISENSEWDAAVEEQRNLTNRAREIDEEIRLARLIEDQVLPEDTVAPGTRVMFTDLTENEERIIRLLGPFDANEDDTLNYKAPLGQALLGMKPGQSTTLEMGGTEHELRVDAVGVRPARILQR